MNPFELHGPAFLALFACLAVAALPGGLLLRRALRGPSRPLLEEPRLSPAEVGYLAGGPALAVHVALTNLVEDGRLGFDHATQLLDRRDEVPGRNELERAILGGAAKSFTPKEAFAAAGPALSVIRNRLDGLGLILAPGKARAARAAVPLALLLVLLFGVVKVVVGVSRGKPVEFLVVGCVLLGGVAWYAWSFRAILTRRGAGLLGELRGKHVALATASRKAPATLHGNDLALAVGLFGAGVLAGGFYAGLHQAMMPAVRERWLASGGGDWSSCSSGWSGWGSGTSSSCSDGSSGSTCGGGDSGGGGGGCGGCGGGGGGD